MPIPKQNNIVGYWKGNLDEDGDLFDSTNRINGGTANHGVLTSDPPQIETPYGSMLEFDGSADYVTVSDNSSIQVVASDHTFAFILRFTTTGNAVITEKGSNDELAFQTISGNIRWAGANSQDTNAIINDNLFHHFVGVAASTTSLYYVDGNLDITGGDKTQGTPNSTDLLIGSRSGGIPFPGPIGHIILYNTSLNSNEVKELYLAMEKLTALR
tara:strand:- start:3805 stop:4446 length:642 start_codon:yes stop_codon:yes gene_type:complete